MDREGGRVRLTAEEAQAYLQNGGGVANYHLSIDRDNSGMITGAQGSMPIEAADALQEFMETRGFQINLITPLGKEGILMQAVHKLAGVIFPSPADNGAHNGHRPPNPHDY